MEQQNITYLNTASAGLVSKSSLARTYAFYDTVQLNASAISENWRNNEWQPMHHTLARFLDAPVANVAFVPNFSYAITAITHSLRGDERVLLYKNDYPSLLDAFKLNNFDIIWVDSTDGFDISLNKILDLLVSEKIDVLAISHVQWTSGFKTDINELAAFCRQHNITFIVDATQSLGAVHISMKELDSDVLIASSYKWMNAGFGLAVMYMANRFLGKYTPRIGGLGSYTIEGDKMFYEPSVRSFEPGHMNIAGLYVLESAMQEKLDIGLQHIEQSNQELTQMLLNELKPLPVKLLGDYETIKRSSIVIIKDEDGLASFLKENGIIVTHRGGMLRISVHFYNTEADVRRLVSCLKQFYGVAIHDD